MSTHFHRLRIKDLRNETPECVSMAFHIPKELKNEFAFVQGQNITLRVRINNEEIRRSYSICSSPLDNELRIAVKKIPNGKFSTFANSLQVNDFLEVLPPSGTFFTELNSFNKKRYIAFAAGSGITPVISIIKTTLALETKSSFVLIYGNKNRNSIIFREELEAIKNRYMDRFVVHHILSREETEAAIHQGRIDKEKCNALNKRLLDIKSFDEFFICGPEKMIFSLSDWLLENGIDQKKIHFELFTVPGEPWNDGRTDDFKGMQQREESLSHVILKQDGIAYSFDLSFNAESILEAGIKKGADLPFSCKGGVCSTCRAKLIEGKVKMDHNYALEQEEIDNHFILTCQSHPLTEKVIIDFDIK